ncbi:MAG: hypothetical protein ACE5LB_03885 [Acidiferrobacterales bacterium]
MTQQAGKTEGERRIRAAVRTVMSSGVWLVVAVKLLLAGLLAYRIMPMMADGASEAQQPSSALLFAVLLIVYAYLMSGASRSFALGTATVSAQETVNRGKEVFSTFLWFAVKILFLALVLWIVLVRFTQAVTGGNESDIEAVIASVAPVVKGLAAIVPFALAYWLPIVFVRKDFRIVPTMWSALQIIFRQLLHSGFLAFLLLLPLLVIWLVPATAPVVVTIALSTLTQMMAWIAYVYCVEAVIDNPGWVRLTRSR